jgi:hypothetical protein
MHLPHSVLIKISSPRGTRTMRKPVSRLSEQTGLPSHQTGLQADLLGLDFDLHPNPSPSPNKPVGAGASPFCKPKTSLSSAICAGPSATACSSLSVSAWSSCTHLSSRSLRHDQLHLVPHHQEPRPPPMPMLLSHSSFSCSSSLVGSDAYAHWGGGREGRACRR